jgi:hypothetical protein
MAAAIGHLADRDLMLKRRDGTTAGWAQAAPFAQVQVQDIFSRRNLIDAK